jgi:hypothetical protein
MIISGQTVVGADNAHEQKYFKTKEEYNKFLNKLLSLYYNYRIIGEIVDPEGNIATDVSVLSSKSKGPMDDSFDGETFLIKDGKFDFSSKGVFSWGLTFEKSQHYKIIEGIGITNVIGSLASGEAVLEGNTIVKKVKVVLQPWGNINRKLVATRHNIFSYSEEDDVKKIKGVIIPYLNVQNNIRKDEEFQFTFKNEYTLPRNLIYIVPGRNEDGSNDGTIRLKTNIPKSGFIRLEYTGKHFFRRMWEAPETGYHPELILKEDFGNSRSNAPYIIFYFKVKDIYGKGLIMPKMPDSTLESDKASLRIYLYMNKEENIRNTNVWIGTNW